MASLPLPVQKTGAMIVINPHTTRSNPMKQDNPEDQKRRDFDALARELRTDLFRYAFWLARHAQVADDLVQETLLRAWRSLDSLRDQKVAKQWLLTILRREHARLYERKKLPTQDVDDLSGGDQALLTRSVRPEVFDVRRELFRLDDEYREPLVLQALMGYSTNEIAEILEIKPGAVLTRLFRARKKLKRQLGEDEDF